MGTYCLPPLPQISGLVSGRGCPQKGRLLLPNSGGSCWKDELCFPAIRPQETREGFTDAACTSSSRPTHTCACSEPSRGGGYSHGYNLRHGVKSEIIQIKSYKLLQDSTGRQGSGGVGEGGGSSLSSATELLCDLGHIPSPRHVSGLFRLEEHQDCLLLGLRTAPSITRL